ncbi:hypothetical protein ABEG18_05955 [Alsobacter sp. KACC 23698]|uniref:Tyrosine kinase G-rich domain-containing protein n=1 Tax=Alsobacter sp. KACC 23698 TaxID=3149229 RepID=A0AAU7JIV6_9HYPH
MDAAVAQISKSVTVRVEPNTDVISIAFVHENPSVAASFANSLAEAFVDRQIELFSRPGAVDFFRDQKAAFEAELEKSAAALDKFMRREATYSISEERSLLLKRRSDISASLTATRSQLAEKGGQKDELVSQLRRLKPVTSSPFVSGLVDSLGSDDRTPSGSRSRTGSPSTEYKSSVSDDPPLLMVKVYQESIVLLFRVNGELTGLQRLQTQQQAELQGIDTELRGLSAKAGEFERLRRELALATLNVETYSKRTVDEQITTALQAAKFTSVRVIQPAAIPLRATYPRGHIFLLVGTFVGAIFSFFVVLLPRPNDGVELTPSDRTRGRL